MNWSAMYGFIAICFFVMMFGTCFVKVPDDPRERRNHFLTIGVSGIAFLITGALCFLNWGVK